MRRRFHQREKAQAKPTIKVGLRFARSEAPRLNMLADRVRNADFEGDVSTFEQAALAAQTGEPLEVICNHPDEAELLAAGYALHGIKQPSIEELNG